MCQLLPTEVYLSISMSRCALAALTQKWAPTGKIGPEYAVSVFAGRVSHKPLSQFPPTPVYLKHLDV